MGRSFLISRHTAAKCVPFVYTICLVGAGLNHANDIRNGGWLPYHGAPLPMNAYWTSLAALDPLAVARHLDGALFTPSSLRDAEGRILLSAGGEFDADAVLPKMPPVEPVCAEDDAGTRDDEPAQLEPPTPERVARRALALAAVAARALLEQDDPNEPWVTPAQFLSAIMHDGGPRHDPCENE